MLALLAIRCDHRGPPPGVDHRFYKPADERYPPRTGPAHPWLCRPCDIEWYGPEGSTCFYCDQPGVRR